MDLRLGARLSSGAFHGSQDECLGVELVEGWNSTRTFGSRVVCDGRERRRTRESGDLNEADGGLLANEVRDDLIYIWAGEI